jgi:hypothetical protein
MEIRPEPTGWGGSERGGGEKGAPAHRDSLADVAAPRVYSHLPEALQAVLSRALGETEHVRCDGDPVAAAERAVEDPQAVAFVGPFRSLHVGETAAILNAAGIAQIAPTATYAALTRDEPGAEDGMPESLRPTGRASLFRVIPRDTAVARAITARVGGQATIVSDATGYGMQVAAQLRLAGLEPGGGAVVYAGLGDGAPFAELDAAERIYAFDGAAQGELPERLGDRVRYVMGPRGQVGWSDDAVLDFAPQTAEAGMLVYGSLMAGGPTRIGVLAGLLSCGRFDEHGDTNERRIGVWRFQDGRYVPEATIEDPG